MSSILLTLFVIILLYLQVCTASSQQLAQTTFTLNEMKQYHELIQTQDPAASVKDDFDYDITVTRGVSHDAFRQWITDNSHDELLVAAIDKLGPLGTQSVKSTLIHDERGQFHKGIILAYVVEDNETQLYTVFVARAEQVRHINWGGIRYSAFRAIATSTATGAGGGAVIGGPIGAVVGGVLGFVTGGLYSAARVLSEQAIPQKDVVFGYLGCALEQKGIARLDASGNYKIALDH